MGEIAKMMLDGTSLTLASEASMLKALGITPDQLKIARALDREKVEEIRANISFVREGVRYRKMLGPAIIGFLNTIEYALPTFPPEEDKP